MTEKGADMETATRALTVTLLTLAFLASSPSAAPAATETLGTEVSLLIGRPPVGGAGPAAEGVLVVPGIVIPVETKAPSDHLLAKVGGEKEARLLARNTRLKRVASNLIDSLRLGNVEVRYQMRLDLSVDDSRDLPSPTATSDLRIGVRLLGYTETAASYEVSFDQGSMPITRTPITVQRGKQAVVGGLDGPAAPYLFLVVAPDSLDAADADRGPFDIMGAVRPPIAIDKAEPSYTPEAKERRIEGAVLLRTIIDRAGKVSDVEILEGLPSGLSEAALETVRTWTFEPATLDGEPVEVYYDLTIHFRLAPLETRATGA